MRVGLVGLVVRLVLDKDEELRFKELVWEHVI
jgi:hypothetical protein